MKSSGGVGMLAVRVAGGTLLAAHGAQKLFGSFNGPGLEKWSGIVESMGMKPGRLWGPAGGISELGGGILTVLGFLNPLGPLMTISAMTVATRKAHWGKPVFVTDGGAELPLTNVGIALAVGLEGPGRYSLDHALGIKLPAWVRLLALLATGFGLVAALNPDLLPREIRTRLDREPETAEGASAGG